VIHALHLARTATYPLALTALALVLASCGGADPTGTQTTSLKTDEAKATVSTVAEGTTHRTDCHGGGFPAPPTQMASVTATQLAATLASPAMNASEDNWNPATGRYDIDNGSIILSLASGGTGKLPCGVTSFHIEYPTVGGANESIIDSAGVMVPTGKSPQCSGPRPIVLYAHGTEEVKNYDMSNLNAPMDDRVLMIAAMFAANGYIVVAPNYAGYDTSTLPYHPYLNAQQQSTDMIDALMNARELLPWGLPGVRNIEDNGKVFLTGHSQGGYVAMATFRAMQEMGMPATAAAPSSGPYSLGAFGDMLIYGYDNEGASVLGTLVASSYHFSYQHNRQIGDIFFQTGTPGDVFESNWLTIDGTNVDQLFPGPGTDGSFLIYEGLYPLAMFNSSPPTAADLPSDVPSSLAGEVLAMFPAITPPTNTGTGLDSLFAASFGPRPTNLWKNSFRAAAVIDALESPDGAFPSQTTMLPATSPQFPLRKALKANDLRGTFTPRGRHPNLQMCGGHNDPEVFFPINTGTMYGLWAAQGVPAVAPYLDVDPYPQLASNSAAANAALPNIVETIGTAAATAFVVDVSMYGVTDPNKLATDIPKMTLAFLPAALQTTTNPLVQAFLADVPNAIASEINGPTIQGLLAEILGSTPLSAANAQNATLDGAIGGLAGEGALLTYHSDLVAGPCHAAALAFFNKF
jgi:hypothetical protein